MRYFSIYLSEKYRYETIKNLKRINLQILANVKSYRLGLSTGNHDWRQKTNI
jgi:hypothetical protein